MHVRSVQLTNFTCHDDTHVDFPDRGLIVVMGVNGGGKSSLVEGVAYAHWGETLRGSRPWRRGTAGEVEVETHLATVKRDCTARGAVKLTYGSGRSHDTTSKAQAQLESLIGSFETWRFTHVFVSEFMQRFSTATDAERKRMLEEVLDLTRFDRALEACRQDLKRAERARDESEKAVVRAETSLHALKGERGRLRTLSPSAPDIERPAEGALADIRALIRTLDVDKNAAEALKRQSQRQLDLAQTEVTAAAREAHKCEGSCPTCGSPIPEAKREAAQAALDAARAQLAERGAIATAHLATATAELEDLADEESALKRRERTVDAAERAWAAYDRQTATTAGALAEVDAKIAEVETSLTSAVDAAEATTRETADLQITERVLGLRGVRAQLLTGALSGVEATANAWLSAMFPGVTVQLRSSTQLKSGGTSEQISLGVEGLAHDEGYKACSTGQKRRIDVAVMLGLADVALAARGAQAPGTLWFDEVLDALDDAGIEGVTGALEQLAQERVVVVITHVQALADRLGRKAARVLTVDEGVVRASR